MLHSRFARLIAGVLVTLALAGCTQGTSTATTNAAPTPVVSATPTAPTGDYAFIRNGDVWVHLGSAPSHAITQLHVGLAAAQWGSLAWSSDHATLAFVLNAPPIAPGFTAKNAVQSTGTLFLADVASGKLTAVPGASAVPITGRHVAWTTDVGKPAVIFTQNGVASIFTPGQAKATPLSALDHVWEVATRGTTLFYTTATNIQPTGAATGELHSLTIPSATDVVLAQLGAFTLPASLCSSIICPPDTATPAVPFTWSVSGDGTLVAYESSVASAPVADATPTPGGATPTPTTAPSLSNLVLQATPAPTSHFFLARRDGSAPRAIFAQLPTTDAAVTWGLALSPDGQYAALSQTKPNTTNYGPFVQALSGDGSLQNLGQADQKVGGSPAWAPTSQAFTLTAIAVPTGSGATGPQDHTLTTFLVNGQRVTTERIGDDLVWGA